MVTPQPLEVKPDVDYNNFILKHEQEISVIMGIPSEYLDDV
jgi:hypothetical protein